jgi:nucleoid-associated protein YgaU
MVTGVQTCALPISQQPTGQNNFPTPNLPPVGPVDPITTPPPTTEARTHTVAAGETLGEISQKYYNTARNWKKIAEANKVDPSELKVGQKITIPVLETATSTTTGMPVELASGERSYTLKKGDSYYSIAKQELGNAARWKEIEKLNNIPAEELRVGKTIKLPSKEAAVTSITKSPTLDNTSSSDGRVHVVASGETLMDISKKHYGTTAKWKDIIKANPGVDPEGLRVGQKLNLPDIAGASPTSSTNSAIPGTTETSGTYTVQAGDVTLAIIAEKELGSSKDWPKIVAANPGLDPRKLRIGQKLIIPGKSGGSSNSGVTTPPANTGTGFGTNDGFGGPTNNNGFGGPANNNGFGGPTNNNGFGGGTNNSTPPSNNSFGPSTLPPNNGLGTTPAYPAPTSTPPPSGGGAFPPASTLPDTFGGASGFGNPQ